MMSVGRASVTKSCMTAAGLNRRGVGESLDHRIFGRFVAFARRLAMTSLTFFSGNCVARQTFALGLVTSFTSIGLFRTMAGIHIDFSKFQGNLC